MSRGTDAQAAAGWILIIFIVLFLLALGGLMFAAGRWTA